MPPYAINPISLKFCNSTNMCKLSSDVFTEESWKNLIKCAIENPADDHFFAYDWGCVDEWTPVRTPPSPSPSSF